jgi:glycosyltransferase involved in cell wall biosynthesis
MTRPRIAIDLGVLDQLWPGAGLYRYATDLLCSLRRLDPPARFLILGSYTEPIDALKPVFATGEAWEYRFFPRSKGWAASYRDHARLAAVLAGARVDLCHSLHTFVSAMAPCSMVVTIQDMMFELFPEYAAAVRSRPYRILRWCTRHRVHRIICPSQTTADDLTRLWGVQPRRIDVVPHGLCAFQPGAEAAGDNSLIQNLGTAPIITSALNLEPRKNLITLLEAFALLRPRFPTTRLVLFGRGGWSAEREQQYRASLASLGLAGVVVETGTLSDAELWRLYRHSTLFVVPTLYEGFGYPALEAMAAGACVVVRGHSSMAEVVGAAGVQVEPLTATALANAISGLLVDAPQRRRFGEKATARARQFTGERMGRDTFASYERSLQRAKVTI